MKTRLALVTLVVMILACGSVALAQERIGTTRERDVLKAAVTVAAEGLGAVAAKPDGTYDAEMIRTFVNPIRFLKDRSGYFFVYDYTNNYNIAHAVLKDFPGTDRTDYQDSKGMYVIRELSKIAAGDDHSGFLVYHWMNPNTGQEEKKLGYVAVIPGTTLYIGSGIYVRQM